MRQLEHLAGVQDDAGAVGILLGKPCLFFHLYGEELVNTAARNVIRRVSWVPSSASGRTWAHKYVVEQQYAGQEALMLQRLAETAATTRTPRIYTVMILAWDRPRVSNRNPMAVAAARTAMVFRVSRIRERAME